MSLSFFPLAFRMKHITRWGLMRNTVGENLLEHSAECAMLAHALAVIGNERFGKHYDVGDIAIKALYHDISEIYTGDLPTPVKYANADISRSYKDIEKKACDTLCEKLPDELKTTYEAALDHDSAKEVYRLVKAADKLCALIKCMQETANGNHEFAAALTAARRSLDDMAKELPELAVFMTTLLPEFEKTLDEQQA